MAGDATTLPSGGDEEAGPSQVKKMKRVKDKLRKKNRLIKPGCCFLYMFSSLHLRNLVHRGYALYRINIDEFNKKNNNNNNVVTCKKHDHLAPCLVFPPDLLPSSYCQLVELGDYLYFVGQMPTEIFRIAKFRINKLYLHETNVASKFLQPVQTRMKSPKWRPLVFVAHHNLYVVSREYSYNSVDFEMYSPTLNIWKNLKHKPSGGGTIGLLKSCLVLEDTVFFTTYAMEQGAHDESVLSYHLIHDTWNILSTSPARNVFHKLHPAFDPPVVLLGNMIFGGFEGHRSIAASPDSVLTDSTKPMFMRPSLAPDFDFWREFSLRAHYVAPNSASHHMTAMQTAGGHDVLCYVSYGVHPQSDEPVVLFSFFKIPGTGAPPPPEKDALHYYETHVQKVFGIDSYFNSDFLHRKLFKLRIDNHLGRLITCFSC